METAGQTLFRNLLLQTEEVPELSLTVVKKKVIASLAQFLAKFKRSNSHSCQKVIDS